MKIRAVIGVLGMLLTTAVRSESIEEVLANADQDAPSTIQVPMFEDGKFKGYTEEPLTADRSPNALGIRQGDTLTVPNSAETSETTPTEN